MDQEIYIEFDRYLHQEMSGTGKKQFEDRLLADEGLREKFELYKETTRFLKQKFSPETAAFKENLEIISDGHFKQARPKARVIAFRPWVTGIAASLALFIGTWMLLQNRAPQYTDYNQHEIAAFVERGDENNELKAAQEHFNRKEFDAACAAFSRIDLGGRPELQYFYAISLLETSHFAQSDLLLNIIIAGDSAYKYKAAWYLALSKLRQENFRDCKMILQQIPPEAEDHEKAQQLLQELD